MLGSEKKELRMDLDLEVEGRGMGFLGKDDFASYTMTEEHYCHVSEQLRYSIKYKLSVN